MRGTTWAVLVWLVACGGGDDTTDDTTDTTTDQSTEDLDLCEANPVPELDVSSMSCPDGVRDGFNRVLRDGGACDDDDDCRLVPGFCDQGLQGLPRVAVNRCVDDDLITDFGTRIAGCDDAQQSQCVRGISVVGVACNDGMCEELIDE